MEPVIKKDPGIAAVLSFFWTGLGQVYNGQIAKGIALMLLQVVNVLLMFVVIGFITFPITWIYGIWDAHKTAKATHMVQPAPVSVGPEMIEASKN